MSKKILVFYFRGERYEVNEEGHIRANGLITFSPYWIFLGGEPASLEWEGYGAIESRLRGS